MRIAKITSHILRYQDANDFGTFRMTILVRTETQDGIVGWGEGIAMWPEACKATRTIMEEGFAPLLKDAGDIDVARAWELMRAHSWWYGEGGIASIALSAVDMSLWDIKGKEAGKPLFELFGGAAHDALPANASCHVNKATLDACVEEVQSYFARGFRSVKLGLGKKGLSPIGQDPEQVVRFVGMLRDTLGADAEILVDIGNGIDWDLDTGISVAKRLEALGAGWIEEPFHPTRHEDYQALKSAVSVPIASGEREFTLTGYRTLLETGAVDVFGVDPARAEGITGFRRVDDLLRQHGKTINAHAWSTAITTAASLHLSIASPAARLFEFKPHPVVVQQELVDQPIMMQEGLARPPTRPGLGIEVDEKVVSDLSVG
ncbi:mandelate racemase/muconate lactonizing enzyme family protein [Arvimicrobium flavum]|uniref:mandelate racemase/muconate lactonizing enzyme family protein n=1 Tax=Arvimicrobium flavum TaxID=3393320 RepID=UPI00237BCBD2|nr:mandelate racemase/muconate lactonizing enzyme family protein [Mesorhizobium shangrilense]